MFDGPAETSNLIPEVPPPGPPPISRALWMLSPSVSLPHICAWGWLSVEPDAAFRILGPKSLGRSDAAGGE